MHTLLQLIGAYVLRKQERGQPVERDKYAAANLFNEFGQHFPCVSITEDRVLQFIAKRRASVTDGTILKDLNLLSASWRLAQTNGWGLPKNPVTGNKPRKPMHRQCYITREQAAHLIHTAKQPSFAAYLAPAITVGIHCGLRKGELEGLEWQHIDLVNRVISLPAENDLEAQTQRAKVKRHAWIPYNPATHDALLTLQALRVNNSRWVLCHSVQNRAGQRIKSIRKSFTRAVVDAGLPKWATSHVVFRHSPASWLYQEGVPIQDIAQFLRQSVLSVTEMYAHLGDEKTREIYGKVGNFVP